MEIVGAGERVRFSSRQPLRYDERRCETGGIMRRAEQSEQPAGYQVLFPVAVGTVFLLVLVVGAIVG